MTKPASPRRDEDVCKTPDTTARIRRRQRIRAQSQAVGEHVARSPEAAEFYEAWGTPRAMDR